RVQPLAAGFHQSRDKKFLTDPARRARAIALRQFDPGLWIGKPRVHGGRNLARRLSTLAVVKPLGLNQNPIRAGLRTVIVKLLEDCVEHPVEPFLAVLVAESPTECVDPRVDYEPRLGEGDARVLESFPGFTAALAAGGLPLVAQPQQFLASGPRDRACFVDFIEGFIARRHRPSRQRSRRGIAGPAVGCGRFGSYPRPAWITMNPHSRFSKGVWQCVNGLFRLRRLHLRRKLESSLLD